MGIEATSQMSCGFAVPLQGVSVVRRDCLSWGWRYGGFQCWVNLGHWLEIPAGLVLQTRSSVGFQCPDDAVTSMREGDSRLQQCRLTVDF